MRKSKQKVLPALKGFASASNSNTLLLRDIQQHIVVNALKHGQDGREAHKIHVSELTKDDWCPRQAYYKLSYEPITDIDESVLNHRVQQFFDTGHEAHEKWQKWLRDMGILWGSWKCQVCKHVFIAESPEACEKCSWNLLKYKEVVLESKSLPLVGHADGAVPGLKALIEVKGIGTGTLRLDSPGRVREATIKSGEGKGVIDVDALFRSLTRPLRAHIIQTMLYLWTCKELGGEYDQYDKVIFIYESKANQATKEFVVPYSTRLIEPLIAALTEVVEMVENETLPDRPENFEKDKKPCTACVYRTTCWETSDDSIAETRGVSTGRRGPRRQEASGAAADPDAEATPAATPGDPRGHHRTDGRGDDEDLHPADEVGRVPGDAIGMRRGGRAVRGVTGGEDSGAGESLPSDQERERGEGEAVRVEGVPRRTRHLPDRPRLSETCPGAVREQRQVRKPAQSGTYPPNITVPPRGKSE